MRNVVWIPLMFPLAVFTIVSLGDCSGDVQTWLIDDDRRRKVFPTSQHVADGIISLIDFLQGLVMKSTSLTSLLFLINNGLYVSKLQQIVCSFPVLVFPHHDLIQVCITRYDFFRGWWGKGDFFFLSDIADDSFRYDDNDTGTIITWNSTSHRTYFFFIFLNLTIIDIFFRFFLRITIVVIFIDFVFFCWFTMATNVDIKRFHFSLYFSCFGYQSLVLDISIKVFTLRDKCIRLYFWMLTLMKNCFPIGWKFTFIAWNDVFLTNRFESHLLRSYSFTSIHHRHWWRKQTRVMKRKLLVILVYGDRLASDLFF